MSGARVDAVVVGGGHNGLTAAAYLAGAGWSVLVLEQGTQVGGAAVSEQPFPGVDARLSRYSYLVSLLPDRIRDDLGLPVRLLRRRVAMHPPATGVSAWAARAQRLADAVWPTVLEPLPARAQVQRALGDPAIWDALVERPLGEALEAEAVDDVTRGTLLTDGLIGTFASAHDPSLVQNRCFLYHVVGRGTGDWLVPEGGMAAVSGALAEAAFRAGADLRTSCAVTHVDAGDEGCEVEWLDADGTAHRVGAGHVLAGCSPTELARLRGAAGPAARAGALAPAGAGAGAPHRAGPEGAQLKVNLVVSRLPRVKGGAAPEDAFAGTFHVAESYTELEAAYAQAARGALPDRPPGELYCHTLTDPSILGPQLRAAGAHTLTWFGLHAPAWLFRADPEGAKAELLRRTLAVLDEHLDEPLEPLLARDADGAPCVEARSPVDLERDLRLPGGHIFHGDLQWPWKEEGDEAVWGTETDHPRVHLAGAGARRGGGVSGIPGRNAAMAALGRTSAGELTRG